MSTAAQPLTDAGQYTDARLSDGTTLRFQGQLNPDQVRAKVSAYRAKQGGAPTPATPAASAAPAAQPTSPMDAALDHIQKLRSGPTLADQAISSLGKMTQGQDAAALSEANRTGKAPAGQVWSGFGPRMLKSGLEFARSSVEPKNLALTGATMAFPEVAGPLWAAKGLGDVMQHARGAMQGKPDDVEAALMGGAQMAGGAAGSIEAARGKVATPVADSLQKAKRAVVNAEPPQAMVPEARKALTQAIQPGVNIPRAQQSIDIAGPRMQQIRAQSGMQVRNTGDALELNRQAKQQILRSIDERIGPVKELQPDTSAVADAMEQSVSKRTQRQFPAQAQAIQQRAATYRDGGLSLADVEDSIQDANKSLRNYYKQPISGENPTSAGLDATLAEVKALRSLLDDKVGELGGNGAGDLSNLKREYGAQRDVERALARQHAIATRTKGAGLWEGLAYMHAAGDLLSGNAFGAMRGAGMITVGRMLKNLRSPDFLLQQAFHGPKAFEAAEPIAPSAGPPKPAGLLPAPAQQMSGPSGDASGAVRGARYTTPAGLLNDAAPIAAKFIREVPRGSAPANPNKMPPLLPAESQRSAAMRTSTVPPAVDPKFAREAIGSVQDANKLGTKGQGGIRTMPQALLTESMEAAKAPAPQISPELANKAMSALTDQQYKNRLAGEIADMQRKIRTNQDRMTRSRDWRKTREYNDNMGVAERRLQQLKEAQSSGTRIDLKTRGATKDELTQTYQGLGKEDKAAVHELLNQYQRTESYGREQFINDFHLNSGNMKGLPIQEKLARYVKAHPEEFKSRGEEEAQHESGEAPF